MSNEFPYKIDVLYEDADCLVVNKPAGLMVHPDNRSEGPFLTDWIAEQHPEAMNTGEPMKSPDGKTIVRPGIVHRLDRETSGAILIAKTPEAHALLKKQFQDREVSKKYLAFVWGELKEEFGTIDRPIGRSANDFPRWSAQRGARGETRDAETYWTRLWTGEAMVEEEGGRSKEKGEGGKEKKEDKDEGINKKEQNRLHSEKFTLVQAEPKTGRTHQIRVHFQAVQHPVVGDTLYAPKKPAALGFKRMALHARSIEFTNMKGKKVKVTSPLPNDFKTACAQLDIILQS